VCRMHDTGSDIVMRTAEAEVESLTRQREEVDKACSGHCMSTIWTAVASLGGCVFAARVSLLTALLSARVLEESTPGLACECAEAGEGAAGAAGGAGGSGFRGR